MRSKQYVWAAVLVGLIAALFWGMAAETSGDGAAAMYVVAGLLTAIAVGSMLVAVIGVGIRSGREPWS